MDLLQSQAVLVTTLFDGHGADTDGWRPIVHLTVITL